jgi:hypothetical protein
MGPPRCADCGANLTPAGPPEEHVCPGPDPGVISLAKERTLRDLQAANERLRATVAELERGQASLTVGEVTKHGLSCGLRHPHVVVDNHAPVVECAVCHERLDPLEVLRQFANGERLFASWNKAMRCERDKLVEHIAKLKRQRQNLKAQIRRAGGKPAEEWER